MPYNPKTDSNIVVSKKHKAMLKKYAKSQRRTLRAEAELMIETHTTQTVPPREIKAHEAMDKYLRRGGSTELVIMARKDLERNAG